MMTRLAPFAVPVVSALLLVASCENTPQTDPATLVGRWELTEAFRNQKGTETLDGTYFEFGADGRMQTNLPIGAESPTPYEIKEDEIRQKSNPPVTYLIQDVSDSTLALSAQLRGMQFELRFRRAPAVQDTLPAEELEVEDTLQ